MPFIIEEDVPEKSSRFIIEDDVVAKQPETTDDRLRKKQILGEKDLYDALIHNIQKPFHGVANIIEQGVAGLALAAAPESKIANWLGETAMSDQEAINQWENQYQKDVPNSPGAIVGATIGSVAPYMLRGVQQGLNAVGNVGKETLQKFAPKFMQKTAGNVGSGLTQGATIGASVAPSLEDVPESAVSGAVIGGTASAIIPPTISGIIKSVGWIKDAAKGNLPKIHAAKYLRDVAGKDINDIRSKLVSAPGDETAAQATYGIDNDVWQALGEMAKRHDKEAVYRLISDRQKMQELSVLAQKARGATSEESAVSREWMKKRLEAALKPVREGELRKADFAGKVVSEAEKRSALAQGGRAVNPNTGNPYTLPSTGEPVYTGRAGAIQNAGKLYAEFGNQTNQAWKTAEKQLGHIGDVKIARNTEQGIKNYEAAQEFVDIAKNLSNEIKFNERIISAVDNAGLKPLTLMPVIKKIDGMLGMKTTRMSDTEVKVLGALKEKLSVINEGGVPDAFALYELRKKGINEIIDTLENSGQLTKKSAEGALLKLRPMIDKALEDAGAKQWGSGYLNKYSKGIDAINRVKVADALRTLYDENPQKYISVIRGGNPEFVENIIKGQKGITGLFSETTTKKFNDLAYKAERKIKMADRAKSAETALGDVLIKDSWRFRLPALINAKFATANKVLEVAEKTVDRKTMDALVKAMKSGKNAEELMRIIPISQRKDVISLLVKAQKASAYAAIVKEPQNTEGAE